MSEHQIKQTSLSFENKWKRNPRLALASTLSEDSEIFKWIMERNGFSSPIRFREYLGDKRRILDAGCGNGRVTALLHQFAPDSADIAAFDLVAAQVAREYLAEFQNVKVFEADLLGDLAFLGSFDFIYCQEVLHHTPDPRTSFLNLAALVAPKGEYAIYVYKVKAPIREYADDMIRKCISGLSYDEAIVAAREIAELGRVLASAKVRIACPAVKILGIEAGDYDIQRFLYHFFLKCFWSDELSFEDNAAINYDWYHPQICSRHTLSEVLGWFEVAGLEVVHSHVDQYGITVRGRRPG